MARTATSSAYVYLTCPSCFQGISKPFSRSRGGDTYVHQHGRYRCRLWVHPDPTGDNHMVAEVPQSMSLERAVVEMAQQVT